MRRSSGRAQVEPLAALVAVLAVTAGIVVYAGTLEERVADQPDRGTARTTLDGVTRAMQSAGVVVPDRLNQTSRYLPDGWQTNVTLRVGDRRWSRGPTPTAGATTRRAARRVSVRRGPGNVSVGRIRVVLWR